MVITKLADCQYCISTTCTQGKELVGSLSKKLVQYYQQSALKPGIDYAEA